MYLNAWKRKFKVANTNGPGFHKWSTARKSVYYPCMSMKYTEKYVSYHASPKLGMTFKRMYPKNKKIYEIVSNLNGKLKEMTIIVRNNRIYGSFCFEFDESKLIKKPCGDGILGLDWGIKNFLTDNHGNYYNYPDKIKQIDMRIRRLNQVLARKEKGSKNWNRVVSKLNDAYLKQNNIKKNWVEQITTKMLRENYLICIEELNMNQLREKNKKKKKMLHIMNLFPFSTFRDRLIQKAKESHCIVLEINQVNWPSSQICSNCGAREYKPLSQRTVECRFCGCNIDRDQNAAINLVNFGLNYYSDNSTQARG